MKWADWLKVKMGILVPEPETRESENFRAREIVFLHEQDGANERLLKNQLSLTLRQERSVERAYLVRARLDDVESVILCLANYFGPDPRMEKKIGETFRSLCNTGDHLDILFLAREQEAQVAQVCTPFYRA